MADHRQRNTAWELRSTSSARYQSNRADGTDRIHLRHRQDRGELSLRLKLRQSVGLEEFTPPLTLTIGFADEEGMLACARASFPAENLRLAPHRLRTK
ncbi:MAG: hypothetical protein VCC00_01105 [Deltaproteobacteria bacterium]